MTFLFTDIEGSTRRWESSATEMAAVVARHDEIVRAGVSRFEGHVFATSGDGFSVAFGAALDAIGAAVELQRALLSEDWGGEPVRVRMAIHTGEAEERGGDYFGPALNETGRLLTAGHGGQVLVSGATREVLGTRTPTGVGFVDLGEHLLRDIGRPMRVLQISHTELPSGFPDLRTLQRAQTNLPVQMTSFVGRHAQVAELDKLVRGARLVTVTGAGGSGKTRLAIEVAGGLIDEFDGGVWFVDLAPVSDSGLVASIVARAMGLPEPRGDDPVQSLAESAGTSHALVVLDSCEHLLDAVRPLVAALARSNPSIRVLATSREPLGLQGEVTWRLEPLELPEPEVPLAELRFFDAIGLFEERAEAADPGFRMTADTSEAIIRICRRVDGIPLGIELAAARLRTLSPGEIASRLEHSLGVLGTAGVDVAPHHRTLEATLEWSYELLSPSEQLLFGRLSVFAGGWTLDAVEHVAAGDTDDLPVIDLISSLVDKSLVVIGDGPAGLRYRLLEPVRQYSARLLTPELQDNLERRHADYYAQLAETAFPNLVGPDEAAWVNRLEADVDNLRVALAWYLRTPEQSRQGQLMAGALYRFWAYTWRLSEGTKWRDAAVSADTKPSRARARALLASTSVGREGLEEAIELYRRFGPPEELAIAINNRGAELNYEGRWQEAIECFDEAIHLARTANTSFGLSLSNRAMARLLSEHDPEGANELASQALEEARATGSRLVLGGALTTVGMIAAHRGYFSEAYEALDESLTLETPWYAGRALRRMAEVALMEGNTDRANRFLAMHRAALDGAGIPDPQRRLYAHFHRLWISGVVAIKRRNHQRGLLLLAANSARRASDPFLDTVMEPPQQQQIDDALDAARTALGSEAYQRAWAEGSALTLDAAIRLDAEGE